MNLSRRIWPLLPLVLTILAPGVAVAADLDGDGVHFENGDCNDADPAVYPNALELCDGVDNDCDQETDNDPVCDGTCDAAEVVLGVTPVSDPGSRALNPSMTWDGTAFGIAWCDQRTGAVGVYFARVDSQGKRIGNETLVAAMPLGYIPQHASVVWTGSEFGVLWDNNADLFFARLDASGAVIATNIQVTTDPDTQRFARMTWSGHEYGVVWTDQREEGEEIYFTSLGPEGNKLQNDVRLSNTPGLSGSPTIVWTGAEFGVFWEEWSASCCQPRNLYFARVGPNGQILAGGVPITATAGIAERPTVAWTGHEYGLAWLDNVTGNQEIWFRVMSEAGSTLIGDIRWTNAPADRSSPALEWTGTEFAVAWSDTRDNHQEVYFARFDAEGNRLGGDLRVTSSPESTGPNLAWTGSQFGIVWYGNWGDLPRARFARVGCNCVDVDLDGFTSCNDCNDANGLVYPGGVESCNAIDDDCNELIDDDALGEDTDGDSVHNRCDNCRQVVNPAQLDTDADGNGNSCDNCVFVKNPSQSDPDLDSRGDPCDNCPGDYNPFQDDFDGDKSGDVCDNCVFDYNPSQTDLDHDVEGDFCDLDDGIIYTLFHQPDYVEWQQEAGFTSWNSYRGDLGVLRTGGPYTQLPGSNLLASRQCGLTDPWAFDGDDPLPGKSAFFLTTGVFGGESSLGTDSAGSVRPNANPCP